MGRSSRTPVLGLSQTKQPLSPEGGSHLRARRGATVLVCGPTQDLGSHGGISDGRGWVSGVPAPRPSAPVSAADGQAWTQRAPSESGLSLFYPES